MLKRINWRLIGKGFAWAVCLSGVIVLMSFISMKKQDVKCSNVKILILGADNFIEREEIDAILKQSQGDLVGRKLKEVNTHDIEKAIQANPYIAFAKVYADMDGVINIQIKQRQPVLRIINAGGQDYYIDRDGLKMPMSANFTANVLVATGDILEGFGGRVDTVITPLVSDLYKTALFLKQDTLWDAQIEQIFVNDKRDIELIPRVGNQRIILGNADSLAVKMGNLLAFYKQAMPQVGWEAYKTINIKYVNQIVCEKNGYDSLAVKRPKAVIDSSLFTKPMISASVEEVISNEIKTTAPVKVASAVKSAMAVKKETVAVKKEIPNAPLKEVKKNEVKPAAAKEIKSAVAAKENKVNTAKETSSVKSDAVTTKASVKPNVEKPKAEATAKEKTPVKSDPSLYKPPVKGAVEKTKSIATKKEKTDTKNQR